MCFYYYYITSCVLSFSSFVSWLCVHENIHKLICFYYFVHSIFGWIFPWGSFYVFLHFARNCVWLWDNYGGIEWFCGDFQGYLGKLLRKLQGWYPFGVPNWYTVPGPQVQKASAIHVNCKCLLPGVWAKSKTKFPKDLGLGLQIIC